MVPCLFIRCAAPSQLVFASCITDPLVSHGRHFCCTVYAMCNINSLLTNGIVCEAELADTLLGLMAVE